MWQETKTGSGDEEAKEKEKHEDKLDAKRKKVFGMPR